MGLAIAFNPCTICDKKEMCSMCELDMRRKGNVETVQEHGYLETVVEVKDNTVKFLEDDFCGHCGANIDLPQQEGE